ncbi:phytanoyl-CoA dioxygenase family protein [Sphingopyxis sp. 113P3]|uniref:phytanoyl-CoA dioxygenase family protein n=1 Tax=Sphingopyxis sp. (strain 113P3) TaxID=292913 RepID=UPI0006AD4281|nr:phytanoyl-CoA dioxygenase family protein [Sphingopyxis sp. 113P3]ALC10476.1 hypothetical protein LH20_00770 [Sphingopyxis sp. 113P3]
MNSEKSGDETRQGRPGYVSAPFLDVQQRNTLLFPELRRLGLEQHIAELAMQGYTIVSPEKVAPPEYIVALRAAVLRVSEKRTGILPDWEAGLTHQGQAHPLGQFMRYVLWEDAIFEPVLTHPVLLGLITYLVGFDAILSLYDAMLKGSGGKPLPLHNDNGDLATPVYADQPQSANINLLLSDYEEGSGPIAFLPGSHAFRRQPTLAEIRELEPEMVPVIAPAGSAVIWPANTWHVARPRTDPGIRATLLLDFCRGHLQTQSPFRADVTQAALDRNPPRFAQLMHQYGAFPFREEDIDRERTAKGGERHSLFDCHAQWRQFFGIGF